MPNLQRHSLHLRHANHCFTVYGKCRSFILEASRAFDVVTFAYKYESGWFAEYSLFSSFL
jgi:hypothetical protein